MFLGCGNRTKQNGIKLQYWYNESRAIDRMGDSVEKTHSSIGRSGACGVPAKER